jgi:hypothetical protein
MEINYFLAIGYALIGWLVQVTVYYFQFDTDEAFDRVKFWRMYDKYIVLGFVSSIAIALLGDFAWPSVVEKFGWAIEYDERVNIILGGVSVLVIMWFSRNVKKKLEG